VLPCTPSADAAGHRKQLSRPNAGPPRKQRIRWVPIECYGSKLSPAYKQVNELARKTRQIAGSCAPLSPSLNALLKLNLRLPVIQLEIPQAVEPHCSGSDEGIVVNETVTILSSFGDWTMLELVIYVDPIND